MPRDDRQKNKRKPDRRPENRSKMSGSPKKMGKGSKKKGQKAGFKQTVKEQSSGFQMGRAVKTSLGWMAIILAAFLLASVFSSEANIKTANFNELENYINNKQIASAVITGNQFKGTFVTPLEEISITGQPRVYKEFQSILPYVDSELVAEWREAGLNFEFKEASPGWFDYLWSAWPIVLIVIFWLVIMRRMQGGMGGQSGLFNFGKSKAKLITPEKSHVTFKDVAGADEAKEELMEIIEFLKNPKKFSRLGGKIPKGALLLGPPGTGKTLLARAVAGEADVPFYSLSGADFVEMFVGVGASRVRDLFEQGRKTAPCIIFIDEIDAVGRHRGAGLGGGHDEREQTLNQLLVEMDGFETDTSVILLASTNRPDVLDKALLRPGRFDRQIVVDAPGLRGREGILKVHTKNIPLAKDVDLKTLARSTPGLVGADLANLVNEAALLAARLKKNKVEMVDIEAAKDKVMMGVERRSVILTPEERNATAYHEAGHALVAYHTKPADPIHKVTIIPRGRSLGVTAQLPIDDKHNYSKSYIRGRLDILMGGRTAEDIVFNEITTGAANDLEVATDLARRMIVEWGMSDAIGPTTLGMANQELFLGRDIQQTKALSEGITRAIDDEIISFCLAAERRARQLLVEHRDQLDRVAEALLERETVHGFELEKLVNGEKLQKIVSNNGRSKSLRKRPRRSRPPQKNNVQTSTRTKSKNLREKPAN